jgi:hypothetical protein
VLHLHSLIFPRVFIHIHTITLNLLVHYGDITIIDSTMQFAICKQMPDSRLDIQHGSHTRRGLFTSKESYEAGGKLS